MKSIKNVLMRIVSVFAASGLSVIGAGSLFGLEPIKSALMAGLLGVATVVESLARSFLNDGKLTSSEINEAFAKVDKKKAQSKNAFFKSRNVFLALVAVVLFGAPHCVELMARAKNLTSASCSS